MAVAKKADSSKRLKGFGSSDASAIIHYAATGEMNNVLLRRIAEIKGEANRLEIHSKYFDLGDNVEEDYFMSLETMDKESNPYRSLPVKIFKNFVVSNHIDVIERQKKIEYWHEVKATKDSISATKQKYQAQLAQHKLIMDELTDAVLVLVHYDTNDIYQTPDNYKYDPDKLSYHYFDHGTLDLLVEMLQEGYQKLDEAWDDIPVYEEKEVLQLSEQESNQIEAIATLNDALMLKQYAEERIASFKESLKQNMEDNGIKSIKTPQFTISYKDSFVRQSVSAEAVKKAHPKDWTKFYKSSNVKSTIAIKINK